MPHGETQDQSNQAGKPKKRDTHFLCFPLTTPTSIPQLAGSLAHFREATIPPAKTPTPRRHEDSNQGSGYSNIYNDASQSQNEHLVSDRRSSSPRSSLRIIPEKAHRPPGTYHLTLGVMDLSQQSEMDRALELLQSLDLQTMLAEAREVPPPPSRSRPNQRSREAHQSSQEEERSSAALVDTSKDTVSKLDSLSRPISPPRVSTEVDVSPEITSSIELSPITISLTGLAAFNSPRKARVFYAKPNDPSQRLLNFGLLIRRQFREAGFITETRPLVLHATVANMRYAVQAHGGRTSKGRKWARGKQRWQEGIIDATEVVRVFDTFGGRVEEASSDLGIKSSERSIAEPPEAEAEAKDEEKREEKASSAYDQATEKEGEEYLWAKDIVIDRVALCKMGAEKSDDETLGLVYPPVSEKKIFSD